ncbi:MAG: putative holin-like toxin [Streptococcus suis]
MGNSSKSNRKEQIVVSLRDDTKLILGFGSFLLSLIGLVIIIVKMSNKK